MVRKEVLIDVDKLGIDTVNVRGGEWELDEEAKQFVEDIKNNGIIDPLLVRPAEGDKYAIVCGSRRYNAAIEAGLAEVPCFIEEMNDVTAMGRSIAENKYSEGIPVWRYAALCKKCHLCKK